MPKMQKNTSLKNLRETWPKLPPQILLCQTKHCESANVYRTRSYDEQVYRRFISFIVRIYTVSQ